MGDGPSDADLEAGLAPKAEASWARLAAAVQDLKDQPVLGRWLGNEQVDEIVADGVARPVYSMPYVDYSEEVLRLLAAVAAVGAMQPFDWMAWDGLQRFPGGRGLDDSHVAESIRVITAVVRSDRFSEGAVLASLDEGTLLAAIRRLLKWYEHRNA